MKQLFIIANWKENNVETTEWFNQMDNGQLHPKSTNFSEAATMENKKVVVCPPFTLLSEVKKQIAEKKLSMAVGCQNISQFTSGAHTGEESGEMLKTLASYVIIGHSERRKMGETDDMVNDKIARAIENGLTPIVCISNKEQMHHLVLPQNTLQPLVAFEPLEAIGTGKPEDPQDANIMAANIKEKVENVLVLYGGSVTAENVHAFTKQELIDGVLVGGASLDAQAFSAIVQNA